MEHINSPELESMETVGESRMFPDEITDLTVSVTPIISKGQLYRKHVTFTALYNQWEPTISTKSKYDWQTFKAKSYHSQDATAPSGILSVNPDNEFPFVKDSENTKNRAPTSPM